MIVEQNEKKTGFVVREALNVKIGFQSLVAEKKQNS